MSMNNGVVIRKCVTGFDSEEYHVSEIPNMDEPNQPRKHLKSCRTLPEAIKFSQTLEFEYGPFFWDLEKTYEDINTTQED